jgi:hypothetical protein
VIENKTDRAEELNFDIPIFLKQKLAEITVKNIVKKS